MSFMCETLPGSLSLENVLFDRNLRILAMPKDGLCLISACATSLDVDKITLADNLRVEFDKNRAAYAGFFVGGYDIETELNRLLDRGVFDSDISDVCVGAIANVTGACVIIYELVQDSVRITTHRSEIPENVHNLQNVQFKTINLLRSGNGDTLPFHYDLLINRTDTPNFPKASKSRHYKQQSIMSLLKRKMKCSTTDAIKTLKTGKY